MNWDEIETLTAQDGVLANLFSEKEPRLSGSAISASRFADVKTQI